MRIQRGAYTYLSESLLFGTSVHVRGVTDRLINALQWSQRRLR